MRVSNCSHPFFFFGLIILLFLIFKLRKDILFHPLLFGGFVLIFLGALVNLVGIITSGCVNDYYSFFGLFYFNIPDTAVTIGVVLTTLYVVKFRKEKL